ncbi:MAG: hypothetical protein AAF126_00405 [Chloroflexota bacterium]
MSDEHNYCKQCAMPTVMCYCDYDHVVKCRSCNAYPAQHSKDICVKCEKMGFVLGDTQRNEQVRLEIIAKLHEDLINLSSPD